MNDLPLVSIVTPVLNLAPFIEETIRSVLDQDYPRIEYIVMDGGSTDGTLEILQKYRDRLIIRSGPDRGAADAVNRGFRISTGAVFAFLNADDLHFPGAVRAAVEILQARPEVGVVYGGARWVDESGAFLGDYPVRGFDKDLLAKQCFICQPASFMRREVFERAGMLNVDLLYTFDYDLWIRAAGFATFQHVEDVFAGSRMHQGNKTLGRRREAFEETVHLVKHHFGYAPFELVYAYACHLVDGRDQFFEPLQPSIGKYLLGLAVGWYYNPGRVIRYTKDWSSAMTFSGLMRRMRGL